MVRTTSSSIFRSNSLFVIDAMHNLFLGDTQTEVEKKDSKRLLGWLRMPLNLEINTMEGHNSWLKKSSGLRLTVLQLASDELKCQALPADERKVVMRRV